MWTCTVLYIPKLWYTPIVNDSGPWIVLKIDLVPITLLHESWIHRSSNDPIKACNPSIVLKYLWIRTSMVGYVDTWFPISLEKSLWAPGRQYSLSTVNLCYNEVTHPRPEFVITQISLRPEFSAWPDTCKDLRMVSLASGSKLHGFFPIPFSL